MTTLIWTNPTALIWTNPSALFWTSSAPWTESWIGGSGTYSSTGGTYTVGGTGFGVTGVGDSLNFVNQAATGNIEIMAYVSQTSSNAYAISGLMVRANLTSNDSQCALIGVSPQNGVNFSWRTADAVPAQTNLGPSLATPIWLRLVVSQTSVAGYESADGISWRLVGQATVSLPTDYYVGFASSSNSATAFNTSTFTNLSYLTNVVQRSANLVSWLRSDVGLVYNASNQVSLWPDQSSNGFNGAQSNSTNQPILVTNAVNGLPAVQFTPGGSGQFLQFPAGFDFTAGLSLFVVLNPTTMAANASILDFRNYTGGVSTDEFGLSELATSGGAIFYAYSGSVASSGSFATALTANTFQLLEAVYDGVSSVSVYKNGTLIGTQGSLQTLANVVRNNNFIGESGNGANFFTGEIAEILIFNTNLNSTARAAVESYLLAKFAV
jgi:regulation of enolase protein 1 (concanavalin A-like superfamily)